MSKTLIIGGVAGGASCAARLRRLDETAEIIVLERGPYISYANCGLPYHIGNVIRSRDALLVTTKEQMETRFNIDVRPMNEAVKIDRKNKCVEVRNNETGETYTESYDTLVLATGSSPLRPRIPGIDNDKIKTLWTVPDTDAMRAEVYDKGIQTAVVVGGGFIGLETAENLNEAGVKVTIVEAADQVMAPLDYEMAQMLQDNIVRNGVELRVGDAVDSFEDKGNTVRVVLASGAAVEAELVVLSIGVRANSKLAADAGLALNPRGGIVVDDHMRTEDPSIYAVGDAVEVTDVVSGQPTMVPLAGPANKQGRIAANNIAGGNDRYEGTQGSSVAKVFDLTAASTGANEKTLARQGKEKGKDYEVIYVTQNSHAGYYPGAKPMTIKLLFTKDGGKILGAQIVGFDGVDKRIDTIGVALRLGAGVDALTNLELAYAPPYSSAKDPVNMAGFTAENLLNGMLAFAPWNVEEALPDAVLLDVREAAENMVFAVPNAVNIPLGQLRDRLGELDKSKTIVVFCAVGVRAYNANRILRANGFENVLVYPGGTRFYMTTHYKELAAAKEKAAPAAAADDEKPIALNLKKTTVKEAVPVKSMTLDCIGLQCPGPIVKVYEAINGMEDGDELEVRASDPGFVRDIGAWCTTTGNTLISAGQDGNDYKAVLRKGVSADAAAPEAGAAAAVNPDKDKTIVVFSGDMDKVMASFIIANGAAAMGKKVTMFFTFWGLSALRKRPSPKVPKGLIEHAFGLMLPKGVAHMGISKWNMGGMGGAMMRWVMKQKNVDSLQDLMETAMKNGVTIQACSMSMDVMGIKPEELIDGIEIVGVGTYLGAAETANHNLFI